MFEHSTHKYINFSVIMNFFTKLNSQFASESGFLIHHQVKFSVNQGTEASLSELGRRQYD